MVRQVVKGDRTKKCSFAPSEPDCYGMPPSKILRNGRYEQHKDIAPKPDTKKKVVSEGENTEKIVVWSTSPTSSKLQARSTIQNNISWMDSFPLLYGLPYCQEPMGSFVSSLLEAKCSDQMESRNFDDVSFFSDNCFCERNQDIFRVEDVEDLLEFDDYQEENDPTSTKYNSNTFCNY
eukprot:CAMPEP_0172424112 /NCGR_PEP_ID=MMETSP1064-20121228/21251_1 /TAXON_ID=202472 /ORGANISM="Aulacoseira subarctica , Strain CCAP 1002/5" /LENGTH=177 /DNA_ID=CAMNT_0013165879 /DNA_START=59 /DNA_END=592 /DNA_ORIENTATION=-